MNDDVNIKRFGNHHNGLGFLRLLFASLVVVAHTPEMIYGDRRHELLTRVFGTISFGELAVDGFFLISGYLIVGSYLKKPVAFDFMFKRIGRIYPAFIAAFLISLFVVTPLAGGIVPTSAGEILRALKLMLTLQPPEAAGIFTGTHYPLLNGAMWTIAFEFRCYLLVLVLGSIGLLRRPSVIAVAAAALLILSVSLPKESWEQIGIDYIPGAWLLTGRLGDAFRLTGIYLVGALFYLYRDRIRYTATGAMIAAPLWLGCMFSQPLAEIGLALFGGYLLFGFAFSRRVGDGWVGRVNNENDISYGVYLYAWPIEKLLLRAMPGLAPVFAVVLTLAIAFIFGAISWFALERPVMRQVISRLRGRDGRSNAGTSASIATTPDG